MATVMAIHLIMATSTATRLTLRTTTTTPPPLPTATRPRILTPSRTPTAKRITADTTGGRITAVATGTTGIAATVLAITRAGIDDIRIEYVLRPERPSNRAASLLIRHTILRSTSELQNRSVRNCTCGRRTIVDPAQRGPFKTALVPFFDLNQFLSSRSADVQSMDSCSYTVPIIGSACRCLYFA
jgi:hypothetical protein